MGVFPRRNATLTAKLFSPLAQYLGEQLGRPVRLVTAKDFSSFWQGVVEKRYDIVHYNQYHYIQSAAEYAVIACNEEQGRDVISGALYVRRDSGISEVSQLRGRNVIFGGGPDAMMSHIVPRYLLYEAGLGANDFTAHFAANPPNAVLAVYFRQADAGGAGDVVMNLPMVTKITGKDELAFLAVSEPIKHLPWAVRKDMPQALRAQIQSLMVGLASSERGRNILKTARLTGMSFASDSDYDSARSIIRKVMPLAPE
jgi:phosphonate transport system substrate-binding protein